MIQVSFLGRESSSDATGKINWGRFWCIIPEFYCMHACLDSCYSKEEKKFTEELDSVAFIAQFIVMQWFLYVCLSVCEHFCFNLVFIRFVRYLCILWNEIWYRKLSSHVSNIWRVRLLYMLHSIVIKLLLFKKKF